MFKSLKLATSLNLYLHRPTATDPSPRWPAENLRHAICPCGLVTGGGDIIDWDTNGPEVSRHRRSDELKAKPNLHAGLRGASPRDFYVTRCISATISTLCTAPGFQIQPTFASRPHFHFHQPQGEGYRGLQPISYYRRPAPTPALAYLCLCSAKVLNGSTLSNRNVGKT
jgi:hypothetical protein